MASTNSRETLGAAPVERLYPPEALDDLPLGESTLAHPTHEAFGSRGYTWPMRRQFHMPSILVIVYVVVGLIVAQQHHYFSNLGTIKRIVSAVLAVLLWWLLLLGINLHIK